MQNLKKLTTEQINIINENYDKTVEILNGLLGFNNRKSPLFKNQSPKTLVEEAISYIPNAVMEYDKDRIKDNNLPLFIAYRAILRLSSEYRKVYQDHQQQHLAQDGLLKKLIYKDNNNNIDEYKEYIIKESEKYFPVCENPKQNRMNITYKKIIYDYVLPKIESDVPKSFKVIAQETGYTYSNIFALLKSKKMQDFIKNILQKDGKQNV